MNKKGQVMQNIGALGVGIATFAIVLVVAFLVMSNTETSLTNNGDDACADGYTRNATGAGCCLDAASGSECVGANWSYYNSIAWNSSRDLQTATATIPGWVSLIVIVAIGALILGMLTMFRRN